MKKCIALLLVLCMAVGLGACKDPVQTPDSTGHSTGQTGSQTEEDTRLTDASANYTGCNPIDLSGYSNDHLIDPERFGGKKLQIYGYHSKAYEDLNNMEQVNFIWMIRAAVDEWAYLNNVEVEFVGGYDRSVILGDILGGGHPDLLLYCNKFPVTALSDIARPFTQEEYDTLAETCGKFYLDMLRYKGESYGVQSPWSGGQLFYYNKTQFEKYGVKSPGQYFMEDNWNWDTYETCIKGITRDEDGDGINELYGSGCTSFMVPEFYWRKLNADGTLTSLVRNSEAVKRFLEIYNSARIGKYEGRYTQAYVLATPRPATSVGETLWYDFAHMHRVLDNGDVIEAIPMPKYTNDSESYYQHTTVYSSILSSCDEPEATLSLLNYILRVGMRYMSDYSLGLYHCNYQGIRGATEYSAGWNAKFAAFLAERQTQFDKLTGWDHELYLKTTDYIIQADRQFISTDYPKGDKVQIPTPPTYPISLSDIADEEEYWIKTFNETYGK